jgi:cytochrome c oxidase assembly protein subunit 15
MREYRLAILTAASALALAIIGTFVDPDGGALACPDWPLCQGEALPSLTGRVLVEHGHRLVALWVATLTAALAVTVLRRRADPALRRLALGAVALVLVQAAIGAAMVLLGIPDLARVGHVATALVFFAIVVHLALRLRASAPPAAPVQA